MLRQILKIFYEDRMNLISEKSEFVKYVLFESILTQKTLVNRHLTQNENDE